MAKKKVSPSKTAKPKETTPSKSFMEYLEEPKYILGFFILLFVVLILLYKPIVFDGLEPTGADVASGIGLTHQIQVWGSEHGHTPLWNPYVFAGMPTYPLHGAVVWSLDTLLYKLGFLADWRIWFLMLGAFGIFLLAKFWRLPAAAAMLAATAFVLMPHFQALIIVGHNYKFRALMWMPYVILTALMLLRRKDFLSGFLFALALALQFRTQHYQIVFYTLLAILFFAVPILFGLIKEKAWGALGKVILLGVVAIALTGLSASQNMLSIKEYTPYSTRGGNSVSLNKASQTTQEKKGVGFDYATNWSYSVSEFWNLIIPKFHGGTSNELYTGSAVPQLKGQQVPAYWGSMPFTQSYEYLGIILVFLAVIAVLLGWHRWEIKSLSFLTLFALLLSLGKHFAVLYKLFFLYVPYFDKFRVPMMILTLVMFTTSMLAAFGIQFLIDADFSQKNVSKKIYWTAGILLGLLLIPLFFGSDFSLVRPVDIQQYGKNAEGVLRQVRLDILRSSSLQSLIFLILGAGTVIALRKKWLSKNTAPALLLVLIAVNVLIIESGYSKGKFMNPKQAEERLYAKTGIENTLLKDNTIYRVFPVGNLFQETHWNYYYQSIGGYSPAKLQVIQDIVENCLYAKLTPAAPLNWNILQLLNVKYVVLNQQVALPQLSMVAQDPGRKLYAYQFGSQLPRTFFVKTHRLMTDGVERLKFMNSTDFHPAETALLEKELPQGVQAPDSAFTSVTSYAPDKIEISAYTDKEALLVVSEIYYPKGWKAVLDDNTPLEIYKTDHLLRSVVVPAGQHKITMTFYPETYYAGIRLSLAGFLIIYLGIAGLFLKENWTRLSGRKNKS